MFTKTPFKRRKPPTLPLSKQKAWAASKATIDEAQTVLTETYLAIYAEGGGMQSDVWDVMVKLLNHQRQLCTEHYEL